MNGGVQRLGVPVCFGLEAARSDGPDGFVLDHLRVWLRLQSYVRFCKYETCIENIFRSLPIRL